MPPSFQKMRIEARTRVLGTPPLPQLPKFVWVPSTVICERLNAILWVGVGVISKLI